ncbi:MAG TPA: hypothetical protein DCS19_10655 [Flavobacterium sp.]|nr:hypothetical protein [Flavobacterium sp.]
MENLKNVDFRKGEYKGVLLKVATNRGAAPVTVYNSIKRGSNKYLADVVDELRVRNETRSEFNKLVTSN